MVSAFILGHSIQVRRSPVRSTPAGADNHQPAAGEATCRHRRPADCGGVWRLGGSHEHENEELCVYEWRRGVNQPSTLYPASPSDIVSSVLCLCLCVLCAIRSNTELRSMEYGIPPDNCIVVVHGSETGKRVPRLH